MTTTPRRLVVLLLLAALGAGACRQDEGRQRLRRAEQLYAQLVERGVPPSDPAYEPVIAELEAVPEDSPAYAQARQRLQALSALRNPLPPRPLRVPGAQPDWHHHPGHDDPAHEHEPLPQGQGG
jgi:hypothetical protein